MSLPFNSLWFSGLACMILIVFFVYFFLYPLKVIDFICDFFDRRSEKNSKRIIEDPEVQPNEGFDMKGKSTRASSIIYNADHYFNNNTFENEEEYGTGSSKSKLSGNPKEDEPETFIPDDDKQSINLSKKIPDVPEVREDDAPEDVNDQNEGIQLREL